MDAFLTDPDPDVRAAARDNYYRYRPAIAADLLSKALVTRSTAALARLGVDAALNRDHAERLARHHDVKVRAAVALNEDLPRDLISELALDDSYDVRLSLSMRPGLSEEERAAIDVHIGPEDFIHAPRWITETKDPDVMAACVHSAHLGLRRSSAYNPALPSDLIALLAEDDDFIVRLLVCENNPDAPGELLLATLLENPFITRFDQIHDRNFPRHGLARFAASDDPVARCLAALDPDAPADLTNRLSYDEDATVRTWVARYGRLSPTRLDELLGGTRNRRSRGDQSGPTSRDNGAHPRRGRTLTGLKRRFAHRGREAIRGEVVPLTCRASGPRTDRRDAREGSRT